MPTVDDFFRVLFDAGEHTNVGPTNWVTTVFAVDAVPDHVAKVFFCINPLKPGSTRSDKAVLTNRNMLIECDSMLVKDQYQLIKAAGFPFSTCVYSGNKSLHFIISLAEACTDEKEYRALTKRIYAALKTCGVAPDVACSNPSRQSRYPNGVRQDNGKIQHLIECKGRVSRADLEQWLVEHGAPPEQVREYQPRPIALHENRGHLRGATLNFLMSGAPDGQWNLELFKAACDLLGNGYSFDEAVEALEQVTGHLDSKDLATVRSAEKRVVGG